MIKRIFQDLDECILHTFYLNDEHKGKKYVEFVAGFDAYPYTTFIRPCAKKLFNFYNSVVGKENVYILTAASKDYARTLNDVGDFGLDDDHILTREDMEKCRVMSEWVGSVPPGPLADRENVLIDNLPSRYNEDKMNYIGIDLSRYFQTMYYFGLDETDPEFFDSVKRFILKKAEN